MAILGEEDPVSGDDRTPTGNQSTAAALEALGVRAGATVFVRVSLKSLRLDREPAKRLYDALRLAVGASGTIAGPANSGHGYRWKKASAPRFDRHRKSVAGGFSNYLLERSDGHRSTHLTHSFVAVGPRAEELTASHTRDSFCFEYFDALAGADCLSLSIGSAFSDAGPGFMTVDRSLELAGLTTKHLLKGHIGALSDEGWSPRRDVPGCSKGFNRMYGAYLSADVLRAGQIFGAPTLAVPVVKALEVERQVLQANPRAVICANRSCIDCGFKLYNKRSWLGLLVSRIIGA